MQLVLTLPGLITRELDRDVRAPHLSRLLAIAGPPVREPDGIDALLAAHYGIGHSTETDCPLAPVRLLALGTDPGTAFWLAADPVTLVAGRDDVRLTGVAGDLDASDAATLVAMLNAHFATDGIEFVAARPSAWFVRAPSPVAIRTRPLAVVTGRMLRDLLPTGPDAGTWRRWQSEIEMLLHEHPVNAARERDGKPPANSVWFYEGGTLPTRVGAARAIRTFAGGGTAAALATHAGRSAGAVPDALDTTLASDDGTALTVVALATPLDLDVVERAWAAPAWTALVSGKLDAVTLIADGGDVAVACTAHRPGPWRRMTMRFAHRDLGSILAVSRGSA